jgi:hypothetical protein
MDDDLRVLAVVSVMCYAVRRIWKTVDEEEESNNSPKNTDEKESIEPSIPTICHETESYENLLNPQSPQDFSSILDTSFMLPERSLTFSATTKHTRALPFWRIHDDQFSVECSHLVHSMVSHSLL